MTLTCWSNAPGLAVFFEVMRATMRINMRMSSARRGDFSKSTPAAPFRGRATPDGIVVEERSCRSGACGARRAPWRPAQEIIFLGDLAEQAQEFVALLRGEGSHGPFLRLGDLGLR